MAISNNKRRAKSEGHVGMVRGKCEEVMREVLGAGRGVQAGEVETPAMAAEARREARRGAESDEEGDGGDGAQDSARVRVHGYATHTKPQGFLSVAPRS